MGSSFICWINGNVSSPERCGRCDNNRGISLRSTSRYLAAYGKIFDIARAHAHGRDPGSFKKVLFKPY